MSHQAVEEGCHFRAPKLCNRERETKNDVNTLNLSDCSNSVSFSSSSLSVENVDDISVILFPSPQSPRTNNDPVTSSPVPYKANKDISSSPYNDHAQSNGKRLVMK